jgi:hypothetical protein
MLRPDCLRIGLLLERRRSGLSSGQRLELEAHLSRCPRCRADAEWLDAIARLMDDGRQLTETARERSIRAALSRESVGTEPVIAAPAIPAWRFGAVFAMTVLLVVMAGTLLIVPGRSRPRGTMVATAPAMRVVAGIVDNNGRALQAGAPLERGQLTASRPSEVELGSARLGLAGGTAIRWRDLGAVALERGEVQVTTAPAVDVSVAAPRFLCRPQGAARFAVREDSVQVVVGVIRVFAASGMGAPLATVRAGETWRPAEPRATAASPSSPSSPSPPAAAPPPAEPPVAPPAAALSVREPEAAPSNHRGALGRARRQLAEGQVAAARRTLSRLTLARLDRAERAEVGTLLAECAQVAGDLGLAARHYREVAQRYPDLPAGETALFAAARTLARAGRAQQAGELLDRYLARYPDGRFRKEAALRRAALDPR